MNTDIQDRPNVIRRSDGIEVPGILLQELKFVATADSIPYNSDDDLLQQVCFLRWATLPPDHPSRPAMYRYTEEKARERAAANGRGPDHYIIPIKHLASAWALYEHLMKESCPNCLGRKGRGQLYAPTDEGKTATRHDASGKRSRWRRPLKSYTCPVCKRRGFTDAIIERCGLTSIADLALTSKEIWWGMEHDGKSRANLEKAARSFVGGITNNGYPGMYTLVGPKGCGKTWLVKWATMEIARAGFRVRYVRMGEFRDKIRAAQNDGTFTEPPFVTSLKQISALLIDQFEAVKALTGAKEITEEARWLREIIYFRDERRSSLSTLVAVNSVEWDARGQGAIIDVYDRLRAGAFARSDLAGLRPSIGEELKI